MTEVKKQFCSQCGSEIDASSKFCSNCGAKVVRAESNEKDEISAAMSEIFNQTSEPEKTVTIPKFKETRQPKEQVHEPIKSRPMHTKKKESNLPILLSVGAVVLVLLLVVGGGFMLYQSLRSPSTQLPPVVDNNQGTQDQNNDSSSEQKPIQKPATDNDDQSKPSDKDLKAGVVIDFTSELGQLEGIASIDEIKVQEMENGNLRFNVSYSSVSDLTMIFANAPDGQLFRIEVDVTGSGKAAYFEVSKSVLKPDLALMITMFEKLDESSMSDGTPIGSGSVIIQAETMAELLALSEE